MKVSDPSFPRPSWWELLLGTALCSAVAWLNGFPLVFSDTGVYLLHSFDWAVPPDRPIFYSLFLSLFHGFKTLWAPVLVQAAIGAFLVSLVLIRFGLRRATRRLAVLAVLVLVTGLSRFAGQLMPDVFLGYFVLSFYLLACHREDLSRVERALLVAILMVSVLVHNTHLVLCGAMLVSVGLLAWGLRRRGTRGVADLRLPALAFVAVLVIWPTVNKLLSGRAFFSRSGHIFLTGRLINDGIVQELLARRCGVEHYALCDYQDDLKGMSSGEFLFLDRPSFIGLGGWNMRSRQVSRMLVDSVRYLPGMHFEAAVRGVWSQLRSFDLEDGVERYGPDRYAFRAIAELYPADAPSYQRSMQETDRLLPLLGRHRPLHQWVCVLSLVLLPVLGWLTLRRGGEWRAAVLPVMVALTLVYNAVLTSLLSGVFPRLQSRAMWLPILACVALALRLWANRRTGNEGRGEQASRLGFTP
ncbi:hypothetical protein [Myxococcus sp. RHSTA-1-4]|uniref:hypothetical protein n=1 Tax=Myxococcus sp. RHSTA-1-4 TaxID=2874601 RepID=UPI001CBD8DF0|nr:hypothetical protein [Myxococcus sp. RHSTA-1-4]MBZ4421563.1 hypothetical protein [Myxococcus sp. RHSTA-1-4]